MTVTPIEVIQKPTVYIRRARSDSVIFIMLTHIENATFALFPIRPLPRMHNNEPGYDPDEPLFAFLW